MPLQIDRAGLYKSNNPANQNTGRKQLIPKKKKSRAIWMAS